jgi:putative endonuclease
MLRAKGYRLLAQRYRTAGGEIDLIMRRGAVTAFIEVKRRASEDAAVFSLSRRQAQRIGVAARKWLMRNPQAAQGLCRFDIVAVVPYQWPRHFPDAFQPDE